MRFRLILLLFCTLATQAAAQENQASPADLDAINQAIARAQSRIDHTRDERNSVQQAVQESEQLINDLQHDIGALEQRIAEEQQRLEQLQVERSELEQEKQSLQETIALYLRSAWQSGRQEYLKLLLNQENIANTSRMVRYYQYFNQARTAAILNYNQTLQRLTETEQAVQTSNQQLTENRRELDSRLASLETRQQERQRQLQKLEQILQSSGQELARLEQERQEITVLLEELNRTAAKRSLDTEPFAKLRGKLSWPVQGRLLNSFGSRQNHGDLTWQGVNIAADIGSEVHAIHHGQIVFADWFGSLGLLLIIDHGDGYMSLYARNQQLFYTVGDWVSSGDIIAASGNTGGHREASLYFEIRHNSRSEDPVSWCEPR